MGCYSPSQCHCEKPIDIGLRVNGGFLSIYLGNIEIENSEVILTQQGVFLFQAYTNGHIYDTSKVWLNFCKTLLSPPFSVPSIIIPTGFPNSSTFSLLNRYIQTEMTSILPSSSFILEQKSILKLPFFFFLKKKK